MQRSMKGNNRTRVTASKTTALSCTAAIDVKNLAREVGVGGGGDWGWDRKQREGIGQGE